MALVIQPVVYRGIPDIASDPEQVIEYTFNPTPGLGPVNGLISAIFPLRRVVGIPPPGPVRYLWHENIWWSEAGPLAGEIDRSLPAGATLFGDSTTTPLLAFLSHRRLACELADTNTLHYRMGHRTIESDLACARDDGLELIVRQPERALDNLPEFRQVFESEGTLWREGSAGNRSIEIFRLGGTVAPDAAD